MAFTEAFGHHQSTALGVQVRSIANVTTVVLNDIRFLHTNVGPQRRGVVVVTIDGDQYTLDFTLTDEALDQRTIQGYTKQRVPTSTRRES